ncbi:MAG: DUF6210 family protein [Planctomycetota bacterium]
MIPWPSGIEYSNQVMGTSCFQESIEGIFVPIGNDTSLGNKLLSPENALFNYFTGPLHNGSGAQSGLTEKDASFIESCLHENHCLRNIAVDRSLLKNSCEAWVHVEVSKPPAEEKGLQIYEGFESFPIPAILTWTNSD